MKKSSSEPPSSLATKGVTINLANCKYTVFRRVATKLGWEVTDDEVNWDIMWCDAGLGIEKYLRVAKTYQRINHFPGMINIYRKDKLAKSMAKMSRISNLYDFTPKTWVLPQDYQQIASYLRSGPNRCVIMKPSAGAQGRGIFLAMKPEQIVNSEEQYIVQSYLHRPLLVDGYKFDLRIYVLITCCDPLRVLLFREGLCRFCTNPYQRPNAENLMNTFMHLTNYSINKHNEEFVQPLQPDTSYAFPSEESSDDTFTKMNENYLSEDSKPSSTQQNQHSSKRSLTWLRGWLRSHGVDDNIVWQKIADIVVKTIISAQAPVSRAFSSNKVNGLNKNPFSCFELLGFDIILDEKCNPYLLEVNHMPSFSTDSPLDHEIKFALISNALQLLNVSRRERLHWQRASMIQSQVRLYGDLFDQRQRSSPSPIQVTSRNALPISLQQNRSISDNLSTTTNKTGKTSKVGKDSSTAFIGNEVAVFWQRYLENEACRLQGFDLVYPTDVYPAQPTRGRQNIYDELLGLADLVFQTGNASIKGLSMPLLSTGPSYTTMNQNIVANGKKQEKLHVEEESLSSKPKKAKKKKASTRIKQKRKELMLLPGDAQDQDIIMLLYTPGAIISPKKIHPRDKMSNPSVPSDTQTDSLPKVVNSYLLEDECNFPPSHIIDNADSKIVSNSTPAITTLSTKDTCEINSKLNILQSSSSQLPVSPRNSIPSGIVTVAVDTSAEEVIVHHALATGSLQPSPPTLKAVRPSFQHISPQRRWTQQQQFLLSNNATVSEDNAFSPSGFSTASSSITSSPRQPIHTTFQSINETNITNSIGIETSIESTDQVMQAIDQEEKLIDDISSHEDSMWSLNRLQQERLEVLLRIANHRTSPSTGEEVLEDDNQSAHGADEDYTEYDCDTCDYFSDNNTHNNSYVANNVHRKIVFDDNSFVAESVANRNEGEGEDDEVDYFFYDQDPDLYIGYSFHDEDEEEKMVDSEPTALPTEKVAIAYSNINMNKSQSKEFLSVLDNDQQSCLCEHDDGQCLVSSVSPLDNSFEQSSSVLRTSQQHPLSPSPLISQQGEHFLYRYSQPQPLAASVPPPQHVTSNNNNRKNYANNDSYDNNSNSQIKQVLPAMTPSPESLNTYNTFSSSVPTSVPMSSPNAAVLLSSGFTMDAEFRHQYAAYRAHYLSTFNTSQKR